MQTVMDRIKKIGVVPVIKLDSPDQAVPLAKALSAGGVGVAEVTFRTDAAEESIRRIANELPDVLIGAGTVITVDQVDRAHKAGAQFIVSPGFSKDVVARCQELGLPVLPGCATPTEVMMAIEMGLTVVKFFPASIYGGLAGIKALAAAFPQMRFVPTGGVGPKNLAEFLEAKPIFACGGSWMVDANDLEKTEKLCAEAAAIVQEVRG